MKKGITSTVATNALINCDLLKYNTTSLMGRGVLCERERERGRVMRDGGVMGRGDKAVSGRDIHWNVM